MRRLTRLAVVLGAALSLAGAGSTAALAHDSGGKLLEFDSMTPVTGAAVGAVNDRGIKGGGLPWVIGEGSGEVGRDGSVEVRIEGLVIPSKGNINPVSTMGATVSCLTPTTPLNPTGIANVSTAQVPVGADGSATIEGMVNLPHPCWDPIVFVVGPAGQWFAMSDPEDGD
jgi:hypothetical protein